MIFIPRREMVKMIKKIKGAGFAFIMGAMMVAASGCGKTEETTAERAPISEGKVMDALIDEAENTEDKVDYTTDKPDDPDDPEGNTEGDAEGDVEGDAYSKIDEFKTTLESDNGVIRVEVEAPVNIRESESYPMVKVSRKPIDNDFLKLAKDMLLGDVQLYDGIRVMDPCYEEIVKAGKAETELQGLDLSGQVYYEDIKDYPIETGLFNVNASAEKYSDEPHYGDYYMGLMPDGDMFYGVTDGSDGNYASITVVNSERYGSSLKYYKNKDYFVSNGTVLPAMNLCVWPVEKGKNYPFDESVNPTPFMYPPSGDGEDIYDEDGNYVETVFSGGVDPNFTGFVVEESKNETNNISKDDAISQAEDILAKLGYSDQYSVVYAEDSYVINDEDSREKGENEKYSINMTSGRVWDIVYERSVNGNAVEDYGEKFSEQYRLTGSGKQVWFGEYIEVFVNDNGVVGLFIGDPLNVDEVVVENSGLMDFEDIKKIYEETQLETLNQTPFFDSILDEEPGPLDDVIKINDIRLTYAKASDPDDFNTGYLIPVWDFSGACYDSEGGIRCEGSFLQINAIDGSIYNSEVGY